MEGTYAVAVAATATDPAGNSTSTSLTVGATVPTISFSANQPNPTKPPR
jgi:hypothetical protein